MKTLLFLLLCLPLAVYAGADPHPSQPDTHSALLPLAPLQGSIASLPVDTLPYTMQKARSNTKTGQALLAVGLASVFPTTLYLAALIGAPLLPQLFFTFGILSFLWGAIKFIQGRIRLRRLRAHRRESPGG